MNRSLLGALAALMVATLACSIFVGGPAYPEETFTAPTPTAPALQDQVQQAATAGADTGTVSMQITEGQLTAYVAQWVSQQSNPVITEPRVYLQGGQMKIYGKATSGIVTANVSITLQVSVDSNGQPQISIVQTDLGPIAAPPGFNEAVAASVQEALTGSLGPVATGFRLESITIGDGVMTVAGRFK